MVIVPVEAFAGMAIVSCMVVESCSGLENSAESFRTTGPMDVRPSERTLSGDFPLTVTRIDLPPTAELPEDALAAWHTAEPKETGALADDRD